VERQRERMQDQVRGLVERVAGAVAEKQLRGIESRHCITQQVADGGKMMCGHDMGLRKYFCSQPGVQAAFNLVREAGKARSQQQVLDRKSTRLNSSHQIISYAVFCLKKKNPKERKIKRNYIATGAPAVLTVRS